MTTSYYMTLHCVQDIQPIRQLRVARGHVKAATAYYDLIYEEAGLSQLLAKPDRVMWKNARARLARVEDQLSELINRMGYIYE